MELKEIPLTLSFDEAFSRLMVLEGAYVNNPLDPGGETNWGISKRSYPLLDIKALTREQAKEIYLRDFWNPLGGDKLTQAIAFQVFDFAVNSGINTAIRKLQSAVGVADDGYWGPISQAALSAMSETDVVMRFVAERLDFWTRLSNWPQAGKGWVRRAAQDLRYAALDT